MKQFSFFLAILIANNFTLSLCQNNHPTEKLPPLKNKAEPCLVTIFVHGTLKPVEVSFSTINDIMQNKIENTLYSVTLEYMRENDYLYRNTPMQGKGLHYIDHLESPCKSGAQTIREIFEMQHIFYAHKPSNRRYYTFGWSGLLSMKHRYDDAKKFYFALEKEVALLRSQNLDPSLHIIAYSHGGNIALNLAKIKKETITKTHFSIEKLILLATPIQKETDHLISDRTFFKKTYLFYSTEDNVQTSDFFSNSKELFSGYRFTNRSDFKLPETLTQVRFRITKRITRSKKLHDKNASIKDILTEKHIRCMHMDPGHIEFWNLQWGAHWYRQALPIAPLPVTAFLPTIIHLIEENAPDRTSITFDYCPAVHGARLITQKHTPALAVPVLNETVITEMKNLAEGCTPKDFSFEEQHQQEKLALKQAYEALKKDSKKSRKIRKRLMTSYLELSRKIWSH